MAMLEFCKSMGPSFLNLIKINKTISEKDLWDEEDSEEDSEKNISIDDKSIEIQEQIDLNILTQLQLICGVTNKDFDLSTVNGLLSQIKDEKSIVVILKICFDLIDIYRIILICGEEEKEYIKYINLVEYILINPHLDLSAYNQYVVCKVAKKNYIEIMNIIKEISSVNLRAHNNLPLYYTKRYGYTELEKCIIDHFYDSAGIF